MDELGFWSVMALAFAAGIGWRLSGILGAGARYAARLAQLAGQMAPQEPPQRSPVHRKPEPRSRTPLRRDPEVEAEPKTDEGEHKTEGG